MDPRIKAALDQFFRIGRMMSSSKSGYFNAYPEGHPVFNANLGVRSTGKIWWGDLDLVRDKARLVELAKALGEDVYILREHDGRFENEAEFLFDRAVIVISPSEEPA
jgi:hypothetical protein